MADTEQTVEELAEANRRLMARLEEYRAMEEDFVAQKVFSKAKTMMLGWVSIGGVALAVFGYTGVNSILESVRTTAEEQSREMVDEEVEDIVTEALASVRARVEDLPDEEVARIFESEISRRVQEMISESSDKLLARIDAQTAELTERANQLVQRASEEQNDRLMRLTREVVALRSTKSDTASKITFENLTDDPVSIYWLDYQGCEVFYSRLGPGASYVQPTYVTHPWVVRAEGQSEPIERITATRTEHLFQIR